jgi:hypothetical protein
MATWAQFESEASQFAAMVRARFEAAETHILAACSGAGSLIRLVKEPQARLRM